jgi:hypothetical protein
MAKRKPKGKPCSMDYCEGHVNKYKTAGICDACWMGMYYWRNATPTRLLKRARQLAKLSARMEAMSPNVRAVDFKPGRRKQA